MSPSKKHGQDPGARRPPAAAGTPPPAAPPVPVGRRPWVLIVAATVVVAAGALAWALWPKEPPVLGYTVVHTYPHDPKAYTQGLLFADGILYESAGKTKESSLRRVKVETGEILQRVGVPSEYFAEGIALWQDRIIQLTWRDQRVFVYAKDDLRKLKDFKAPGEGWGLTTDGRRLIRSDGSDVLHFHDPETYQETGTLNVTSAGRPVRSLNELEWVRGEIWANIYQTDRLARIDPATGRVTAFVDLAGIIDAAGLKPGDEVLNGIAYDAAADRLFVTGKHWPKLFEIRVGPKS